MVLYTNVLRVQYSCGVVLVFWFWWEIVFGVTYILVVQYSCAIVSVFWLWQEVVLKMRTRFYKKNLLGYFVRRDPKVLRRVSRILNKEGLHFANLFYIFE